ncbi:hypothetical protein MBLNU459_g1613t1 [Dothideomycetes sp. NU459]
MTSSGSADAPLERLLNVLAERDIDLGHDDLAWLFESSQTRGDMIAWVTEYLNPDTLLSREELEIYSAISLANGHRNTASSHSLASGRPLEETDIENAIASLESSTAAIEKQCATMEAQREALKELQKRNGTSSPNPRVVDQQRQIHARAKTQKDLETDELAESVKHRIAIAQKQTESSLNLLRSATQRQLDKDDRLLDGLQKVMSRMELVESKEDQMLEVEQLSRALINLQSKTVRERTNRAYLAAVEAAHDGGDEAESGPLQDKKGAGNEQTLALTEELDSLVAEVDSVLEMVVDHQHRRPILDALRRSELETHRQQKQWLDYIQETLRSMTSRLEAMDTSTQQNHAYSEALATVNQTLATILPPSTPSTRPSSTQPPQKTLKPLILHSDLSGASAKDPAIETLRHYGIRLPTSALHSPNDLSQHLQAELHERAARQQLLSVSTEQSIASQVAESVTDADARLQSLLSAVYAYSPFATARLADEGAAKRIQALERDIASVGEKMARLDVEALAEAERRRLEEVLG